LSIGLCSAFYGGWKRDTAHICWLAADHRAAVNMDQKAAAPPTDALCSVQHTHTHTRPFNGPFSGSTQVSRYQKGKINLDFTEARAREWQWHQLGHMQVCTLLQTDNHTSTPPLSFLQAGCPSCRPTNSVKALKAVCSNRLILPACRAHSSKPAGCMPEI